jgi:hypothetical protein
MVQPVQNAGVGETHRIRPINIAPAGMFDARMRMGAAPGRAHDHDDAPGRAHEYYYAPAMIKAIAKDGADLPIAQQVDVEVSPRLGVGETADFLFTPTKPGVYDLIIGYDPEMSWHQRWEVAER